MFFNIKKILTYQNMVITASIIPILIFGFLIYNNSKEERIGTTSVHIKSLNKQEKQHVLDYFNESKFNVEGLSKTISFLQEQAFSNISNIQNLQKNHLEDYYRSVENDIISIAKKDIFQYIFSFKNRGKDVEKTYLENIYAYKQELGIKTILMINKDGKILYSSDDNSLENMNVSQFIESFSDTFNMIKSQGKKSKPLFTSFGYDKSSNSYKQFAISPFKDVDGFIAMEIDQDGIQKIIDNVASLGDTAETYLTYKQKNQTFLATNRNVNSGKTGDKKDGKYIELGFNSAGIAIKYGSLGEVEIVGYMPVKLKNITLSLQTTVAYTEIISPTIKGSDYFEQFMSDYGYNNIMLIGLNGDMFYSVKKEADFSTNMLTGKYSKTNLGKAVKEIFLNKKFVLTDIDCYDACPDGLAQFILSPILDKDGKLQSIVVIQLDFSYLTKILSGYNSIYNTYETYLVGADKKLRSDTRLSPDKHNVFKSFRDNYLIDTKSVNNISNLEIFTGNIRDYRGIEVLSSASTIKYSNVNWYVISEIDKDEISDMVSHLKFDILLFILISSVIALVVMIVITNEKVKQDKKLKHTATHDALTGLPNRKFVLEFLTYILANSKRLKTNGAVLFIDLDKFKVVNDSYGHKTGDKVLIEIASRLRSTLREDDLVARLGGDEFVLIINNFNTLHDIETLCKKIISEISKPIEDDTRYYKLGVSIGISVFPNDSNDAQELLQFADTAMFKTKDNGRNGFTYYSKDMTEKFLQQSRVERELKDAIINDELVLHYQPQVDIHNSKIVGVEALVRWNHTSDGLIMPNDFIPIAEESDLILDLGYWVTYEACRNFKNWKEAGIELDYIAVNMSAKQIQCTSCVENIQAIFDELDFEPRWLELEITEGTLISNMKNTLSNINIFKDLGVKFSIDDFGTGYSSFSYLKSLQISTLKIDREFIKDILIDSDDRIIVQAIIAMGHTLNYTIIAEGAESKEEIELLKYFACNVVQGYYYSKPLPEEKLLKYMEEFKC